VSRARNTRAGVGHRNRFAVLQCRFHGSKEEHVTCQQAWRKQNGSFRLLGQGLGGTRGIHPVIGRCRAVRPCPGLGQVAVRGQGGRDYRQKRSGPPQEERAVGSEEPDMTAVRRSGPTAGS